LRNLRVRARIERKDKKRRKKRKENDAQENRV
jgi:hypothetical protein